LDHGLLAGKSRAGSLTSPAFSLRTVRNIVGRKTGTDRTTKERRQLIETRTVRNFGETEPFGIWMSRYIGLTCLEFAVIGSTVNAASRLEALARALDWALVASDDLVSQARTELDSAEAVFRPLMAQAPQNHPRARAADRGLDAGTRGGVIDHGDRNRLGAFGASVA
jgi:hypothetical protein